MDGESLRGLRVAFGWSQEELAEALEVDVSTVGRWERNKTRPSMTGEVIEKAAFGQLAGRTSRFGAYVNVVLGAGLRAEIDHYPGHRYLLFGRELIVLHMSREAFSFGAPWSHMLVGSSFADYIVDDAREMYTAKFRPMLEAHGRRMPIAVKFYTRSGSSLGGASRQTFRVWYGRSPYPLIWDVTGQVITAEEYEAQIDKFIPIWG